MTEDFERVLKLRPIACDEGSARIEIAEPGRPSSHRAVPRDIAHDAVHGRFQVLGRSGPRRAGVGLRGIYRLPYRANLVYDHRQTQDAIPSIKCASFKHSSNRSEHRLHDRE